MRVSVTARHFRASKPLREFAINKLSRLEKFYGGIVSCDVVLSEEKNPGDSKKVEIIMRVYRSTLTSAVQSEDFPAALGEALERIEVRLKRYKSKLRERYKTRHRAASGGE